MCKQQANFILWGIEAISLIGLLGCASTQMEYKTEETEVSQPDTLEVKKAQREFEIKKEFSTAYEYYKMKNYHDAIPHFKRVLELKPDHRKAYSLLANSYCSLGDTSQGEKTYQEAIDKFSDYAPFYIALGYIYEGKEKNEEAISLYKKVYDLNPEQEDNILRLANLLVKVGRKEEAIPLYEKAVEINPENSAAQAILEKLYAQFGQIEERIKTLEKLHQSKPRDTEVALKLGKAYDKVGKYTKAVKILQELIKLDDRNYKAYSYLGVALHGLKRYQEAIRYEKEAAKLNPQEPKIYCDLASAYNMLGNYAQAKTWVRKARRIDSHNPYSFYVLGEIYEKQAKAFISPKGKMKIEGKVLSHCAYREFRKAKNDPQWGSDARNKMEYNFQFIPTSQDSFFYDMSKYKDLCK